MGKQDTEKILRNWNIVWTLLATTGCLFILYLGLKINFPISNDIGFDVIDFNCEENSIGDTTKCIIETDSSASLLFHISAGIFGFMVIQILQIPLWIIWYGLTKD